jgi:hypothetical protein
MRAWRTSLEAGVFGNFSGLSQTSPGMYFLDGWEFTPSDALGRPYLYTVEPSGRGRISCHIRRCCNPSECSRWCSCKGSWGSEEPCQIVSASRGRRDTEWAITILDNSTTQPNLNSYSILFVCACVCEWEKGGPHLSVGCEAVSVQGNLMPYPSHLLLLHQTWDGEKIIKRWKIGWWR